MICNLKKNRDFHHIDFWNYTCGGIRTGDIRVSYNYLTCLNQLRYRLLLYSVRFYFGYTVSLSL